MKAFIAMDADGTVDDHGVNHWPGVPTGPIPVPLLKQIAEKHKVMVIGNTWLQDEGFDGIKNDHGLPVAGIAVGKSKMLKQWRAEFPGYDRYVVVDDNWKQYDEGWEGWECMSPQVFLKRAAEFT
jgi:hypothetical protein